MIIKPCASCCIETTDVCSASMSKEKMSEKTFVGLLSRLVNEEELGRVNDQLDDLLENYYKNSWKENSTFCCQIIQDHARLQGDLFRLLKLSTEQEYNKGSEVLQKKFLPWLCNAFICSENGDKAENLRETFHETTIEKLQDQLKNAEQKITSLQIELQQASMVIDKQEEELYKTFENLTKLELENSELCGRLTRPFYSSKSLLQPNNKFKATDVTDDIDSAGNELSGAGIPVMDDELADKLVKRFGEIYNNDRVMLMKSLEGLNDKDTNERIIFNIVQSCFSLTKKQQEKLRGRMMNALTYALSDDIHNGKVSEIVANYMKKHIENFNIGSLVTDVFSSVRQKFSSFTTISFVETILSEFIKVVLDVVWLMVSLKPPFTMPSSHEGEIIRESFYRRSYMSEFSSATIHHYIWPCLLRERKVIKKGEVITRRVSIYSNAFGSGKSLTRPHSAEPYFTSLQLNEVNSTSKTYKKLEKKNNGFLEKKLSLSWNGSV